jgi:hypothetical protein
MRRIGFIDGSVPPEEMYDPMVIPFVETEAR